MAKPRDLIPVAVIHLVSLLGNRLRGLQNLQFPVAVPRDRTSKLACLNGMAPYSVMTAARQ